MKTHISWPAPTQSSISSLSLFLSYKNSFELSFTLWSLSVFLCCTRAHTHGNSFFNHSNQKMWSELWWWWLSIFKRSTKRKRKRKTGRQRKSLSKMDSLWDVLVVTAIFLTTIILYRNCFRLLRSKFCNKLPLGSLGWPFIGETIEFISCAYSDHPETFMDKRRRL